MRENCKAISMCEPGGGLERFRRCAGEVEAQIASLRAELLHKEQENERVQLQLLKEREDREKAQKKVLFFPLCIANFKF